MPFPLHIKGDTGNDSGQSEIFKLPNGQVCHTELIHTIVPLTILKSQNSNVANTGPHWSSETKAKIVKVRYVEYPNMQGFDVDYLWLVASLTQYQPIFLRNLHKCDEYLNGFEKDLERYENSYRAGMPEPKKWPWMKIRDLLRAVAALLNHSGSDLPKEILIAVPGQVAQSQTSPLSRIGFSLIRHPLPGASKCHRQITFITTINLSLVVQGDHHGVSSMLFDWCCR